MAPTVPRSRRPPGQKTDRSGDSGKGKAKKGGEDGLRWQHYALIFVLGVLSSWGFLKYYHANRTTYPATLTPAQCLFEEKAPFFVHCKDKAKQNKELLEYLATRDLSTDSFASASVTYVLSLAMRTPDLELGHELTRWIFVSLERIECTRLIDVSEVDFMKMTPRSLCAQANYRDADVRDHSHALEDLNVYFDLMFLMSIYGSELHEGAMRYTVDGQLTFQGKLQKSPLFAGVVESYYSRSKKDRNPYSYLANELANRRNKIEVNRLVEYSEERMGTSLLAIDLQASLAAMRRCNPPANITWMEYHSRALFKRAAYEGEGDGCGWTEAEDSLWEMIALAYYDVNFRFRRLLGKL